MKKKLFLDMDGTLAKFYEKERCLEAMWEKGFYRSLNPYENIIEALKMLSQRPDFVEVYCLSAINPAIFKWVKREKMKWNEKYLPYIDEDHMIFTLFGENKANAVKEMFGEITKDFILLDDYNGNLEEWETAGGMSVKFVNEINDKGLKGNLWSGKRIRFDFSPEQTKEALEEIIFDDAISWRDVVKKLIMSGRVNIADVAELCEINIADLEKPGA